MRARDPDHRGLIERNGVKVGYEVYGDAERTLLFMPTWTMATSRVWKALIPYFARRFDWLAQDPVTRLLQAEGQHIHPASAGGAHAGARTR